MQCWILFGQLIQTLDIYQNNYCLLGFLHYILGNNYSQLEKYKTKLKNN